MKEVYLLLGSNEGNRKENLALAIKQIKGYGKIIAQSSIYETEAWGLKEQNHFLNQALQIETSLSAGGLLDVLKVIEKEIGRLPSIKWGPRVIDIDILFYEDAIIDLPQIKIPHSYLHERRFTLVPLNEIAPDFIHPLLNKKVKDLLKVCKDKGQVIKLKV
jgi:2-amino-4-hydroxy-6-hydroxymethyldihydropteridine diphosphokinase